MSRCWFLYVDCACLFTYRVGFQLHCKFYFVALFWFPTTSTIHMLELEFCHFFSYLSPSVSHLFALLLDVLLKNTPSLFSTFFSISILVFMVFHAILFLIQLWGCFYFPNIYREPLQLSRLSYSHILFEFPTPEADPKQGPNACTFKKMQPVKMRYRHTLDIVQYTKFQTTTIQ